MSTMELDRYTLLRQVMSKQLTQAQAALLLGLSDRQVRNLLKIIKIEGPKGITSKKRGRPSNRAIDITVKNTVIGLVREKYPDFGPTLASEKLKEYHNITISVETLRKWMILEKLWISKSKRLALHPLRPRREHFGELIQIDASTHAWFEDRAAKCALTVFTDDATSKITSAFFCPTECLEGYLVALKNHLVKYGRPRSFYSDRHSIFGGADRITKAHFPKVLKELEIELLLANTPQAKGRVERVNQTLQDRLIKEMRLRNINSIDEGNRFIQEYIEIYNKKFSKEPRGQIDAHRPLVGFDLERTLTRCEIRTVSKDLSFSFYNKRYQILGNEMANRLKNKKIEIRQRNDGTIKVFFGDLELKFIASSQLEEKQILNNKEKLVWPIKWKSHPDLNHPWKKYGYQLCLSNQLKQIEARL